MVARSMSGSCIVSRSLSSVTCPFCGTKAYLVVKVRSTGRFYIAIQHRDSQNKNKTKTHYIEIKEVEKYFGKEVAERIKKEVGKILEELKVKEQHKHDNEVEDICKRIIKFLYSARDWKENWSQLGKYLKIIEALIEVEEFFEKCIALMNKDLDSLSDKERELLEHCREYNCSPHGWSYLTLSKIAHFEVPGSIIARLRVCDIIEQTYKSKSSTYWRLKVNRTKLKEAYDKICKILRQKGILGLIELFEKYIDDQPIERLIDDIIDRHIFEIVSVSVIVLKTFYERSVDKSAMLKVLDYLLKLTRELKLNLSKIKDENVRELIIQILSDTKRTTNTPWRGKVIEFKDEHTIKVNNVLYASFLGIIFYHIRSLLETFK